MNQLFGFSPDAFEQFARALALQIFGPGVTAFGNGPDGGREAAFRGDVPYPYPPTNTWSGYGVIQAKCKEKSDGSARDQKWVIQQLRDELAKFVRSGRRDPKPEYYVFVTNVELSSATAGGKNEAERVLEGYRASLPLKGHAVWDANQLYGFLSCYADIRRRFAAYLTPGDVLGALLDDFEKRRMAPGRLLVEFVGRELRADETSRLDQAGNRTEDQFRLAQLFFDLPASADPQLLPPTEQPDSSGRLPKGVLWELLRDGARKLDPKTLYEQEVSLSGDGPEKPGSKATYEQEIGPSENAVERFPTRYILLGGPGSGKSTVGQFLAQVHRAALLARREPQLLDPQTRRIVAETRELCEREGWAWPATPRYPFRVELNRFAKALTSCGERVESLEQYLLNTIGREHNLSSADLVEWLGLHPWLLVLDGLDEVPSTSNRDTLVAAVTNFLATARQAGADLFVVASSRQQGYSGEFGGETVAMRHILPLSTVRALRYVERYANARFGTTDPTRARDVVDKLAESAKRELTAQLLTSPLQVTFMATVVGARGDPGEDRWQLFDSYYRTVYDRERQKAVPPYDSVLSKQQPTIDRLHHDIGFCLQHRGETLGGTSASLQLCEFERLVDSYLRELGREGPGKNELVRLITDAARHRLVFLTSRVAGELSFEVRSLQEYMAAECLMSGERDTIKLRLRAIAPAPYWRNVFLFAASKCFVDVRSRHLQDSIRLLCEDLNSPADPLLHATRAGAELAVDVLQSGAVAENPNHARHLLRIGLQLLREQYMTRDSEAGIAAHRRLAVVYSDELRGVFFEEVSLCVGHRDLDRSIGVWPLLVQLIHMGVDWAAELGEREWPEDHRRQRALVGRMMPDSLQLPWLRTRVGRLISHTSPSDARGMIEGIRRTREEPGDPVDFCPALVRVIEGKGGLLRVPIGIERERDAGIGIGVASVFSRDEHYLSSVSSLVGMRGGHKGWSPLTCVSEFLREPTAEVLAKLLLFCANEGWPVQDKAFLDVLPWPMANCLSSVDSAESLRVLAVRVGRCEFGDAREWESAENRWRSDGIAFDDFVRFKTKGVLSEKSSFVGAPSRFRWMLSRWDWSDSLVRVLIDAARRLKGADRETLIVLLHMVGFHATGICRSVEAPELKELLERGGSGWRWHTNSVGYPADPVQRAPWLKFFDWIGRSEWLSPYYSVNEGEQRAWEHDWCREFQMAFISRPGGNGLSRLLLKKAKGEGWLRLLGRLASEGQAVDQIPAQMLDVGLFPDRRLKLAAALARLTQESLSEADARELGEKVSALLWPLAEPGADRLVFRTAELHLGRVGAIGAFLLSLRENMPKELPMGKSSCERLLRHVLRRRASMLQPQVALEELELPTVGVGVPPMAISG